MYLNEIRCIRNTHYEYPEKLKNIIDQPKELYVKGKLPEEHKKCVAIVGARNCSMYGIKAAETFACELAKEGVVIISGMARGIDAAAHNGALKAKGETVAVLGCGADICYPKSNRHLYEQIAESGCIISEHPKGTEPKPYFFPLRNRIISGLADVVLIVEARKKSGSLITADTALEQGKDVFAVPGGVFDELSKGCNNLIRQGAGIATSAADILHALGMNCEKKLKNSSEKNNLLATREKLVYSHLCLLPKTIDEIAQEIELPMGDILGILLELEMAGYVREVAKNHFVREK